MGIDHGQSVKYNKPNYFTLEEYCFCFYLNHIFQNRLNFNGTNAIKHYYILIDHADILITNNKGPCGRDRIISCLLLESSGTLFVKMGTCSANWGRTIMRI